VWGYGVLGKGPNVTLLKTPSLLPPPLFGCNELNPYVNVKDISCGMSHFGAITSKFSKLLSRLISSLNCIYLYLRAV
jgi:hypothetical protein